MGFLSNILGTIKRNTLDKTNVDEQIGQSINKAGKGISNFFTKSLPQFANSTDKYLQNQNLFRNLTAPTTFSGKPTLRTPLDAFVIEPSAKVLDTGIGGTYSTGKGIITQALADRGWNVKPTGVSANKALDAAGILGLPKVAANITGGTVGALIGAGTNLYNKKPIGTDFEKNYNEGFAFSSKLAPYEKALGTFLSAANEMIPTAMKQRIVNNPVIAKTLVAMKPEEIKGFWSWARNSVRAGNQTGLTMLPYGAIKDPIEGENRLQGALNEYKNGLIMGTGMHGLSTSPEMSLKVGKNAVNAVNNKITDLVFPDVKRLSDIMGKATDKATPPLMGRAESSFTLPEDKPLSDLMATKKAEIEAKMAADAAVQNKTPLDINKLNEKYAQQDKATQRPLPIARTPEDAKAIRSISDAMAAASKSHDPRIAEKRLLAIFEKATPQQKADIMKNADFNGPESIKKFWAMTEQIAPYKYRKSPTLTEQQFNAESEAANPSLINENNPVKSVTKNIIPEQTVSDPNINYTPLSVKKQVNLSGIELTPADIARNKAIDESRRIDSLGGVKKNTYDEKIGAPLKQEPQLSDFESRKAAGKVASENATRIAKDKTFTDSIIQTNLNEKEANNIRATKDVENIAKIKADKGLDVMKAMQDPEKQKSMPEFSGAFNEIKQLTEKLFTKAKEGGMNINKQENYFPQQWQLEEMNSMARKTLSKNFGNAKSKVIPDIETGIKLGYEPKFNTPAEALESYSRYLRNSLTNWDTLASLKKSGAIVPGAIAEGQPGMKKVEAFGLPFSNYGTAPDGTPGYGGGWYAEASLADKLNKAFGPTNESGVLSKTAKVAKAVQDWVLSGGIPGTAANFFTAVQTLYKDIPTAIFNPEHLRTTYKSYLNSRTNESANREFSKHSDTLIAMAKQGLSTSSSYKAKNLVENSTFQTFFETSGNLMERTGSTWSKMLNEPTFNRHMALKKMYMFEDIVGQGTKKGLSVEQAQKIAGDATRMWFGEQTNMSRLLENRNISDVKTIGFLAPKYREGIIGTYKHILNSVKPSNWSKPEYAPVRQLIAGSLIMQFGGELANYAMNGQTSDKNEPSLQGKVKIPAGKMLGLKGDMANLVLGVPLPSHSSLTAVPRSAINTTKYALDGEPEKAVDTALGNTSSLVQPFARLVTNRDAFSNKIVRDNATPEEARSASIKLIGDAYKQPIIGAIENTGKAMESGDGIDMTKAISTGLELPFRVYNQKNLTNSWYFEAIDKAKKGMDAKTLSDWEALKRPKANGVYVSDAADEATKANIYIRRPELLDKELEVAKAVAEKTGQPVNPLLLLPREKQMTIMRMKTLPEGPQLDNLRTISKPWMASYNADKTEWSNKMKELGIFKDDGEYDTIQKEFPYIKADPETQKKLDVYNLMNAEDKKLYIKENPEIADFFNKLKVQKNEKQLAMGLVPDLLSEIMNGKSGFGGGGYTPTQKKTLASVFAKNKALRAKFRALPTIKSKSTLLDTILKKGKTIRGEYKPVIINTKPSKSFK